MKKALCIALALLMIGASALAAPQLSDGLFTSAKQAVGYLASGEPMTLDPGPHRLLVWPGEGWSSAQATITVQ